MLKPYYLTLYQNEANYAEGECAFDIGMDDWEELISLLGKLTEQGIICVVRNLEAEAEQ